MLTTLELFEWLRGSAKLKVTRERDVANALSQIGGKCVKQVPVKSVGQRATLWVIRDHDKWLQKTAKELGNSYVPFFSDVRVKVTNRISDKEDHRDAPIDASGNY